MIDKELLSRLNKADLFKGLTYNEINIMGEYFDKVEFKERDVVIQEGNIGDTFYFIIEGVLKVMLPKKVQGMKEQRSTSVLLNTLSEGDYFGEYSLIDNKAISASVIGAQSGILIKMNKSAFDDISDKNDRIGKCIYRNLLTDLIERLRVRDSEHDAIMNHLYNLADVLIKNRVI